MIVYKPPPAASGAAIGSPAELYWSWKEIAHLLAIDEGALFKPQKIKVNDKKVRDMVADEDVRRWVVESKYSWVEGWLNEVRRHVLAKGSYLSSDRDLMQVKVYASTDDEPVEPAQVKLRVQLVRNTRKLKGKSAVCVVYNYVEQGYSVTVVEDVYDMERSRERPVVERFVDGYVMDMYYLEVYRQAMERLWSRLLEVNGLGNDVPVRIDFLMRQCDVLYKHFQRLLTDKKFRSHRQAFDDACAEVKGYRAKLEKVNEFVGSMKVKRDLGGHMGSIKKAVAEIDVGLEGSHLDELITARDTNGPELQALLEYVDGMHLQSRIITI